ncbi:MAG: apolipoprotein N-acyltransferase [Anaerohalosphaeraceae bacterium]
MKSFLFTAGLPAVSAGLLTICQAPYDQAWAAWLAWVPFLLACRPPLSLKILLPAVFGIWLVYWLVNLYWLIGVTFPGYLAFCVVQACYGPVLAFAVQFVRRKQWPLTVWAPLIVVGAEAWQSVLFTGFSWYFLAHSQYRNLPMIQSCELFGQLGISVLIAAVNGLAADLLLDAACGRLRRAANCIKVVGVGLLLGLNWSYGIYQLRHSERFLSDGPLVGAVQTNIPSHIKELSENGPAILQTLLDLSEPCFEAGAWMTAWPETMVLASLNPDYLYYLPPDSTARQFDRRLRQFAHGRGYLLVGAHAVRISTAGGEPIAADQYNSAFLYEPTGQQHPSRYDKIHLVPFGEYIPFRQTLPRLYGLIHRLSPYDYDYNLTPGQKYTRFSIEKEGRRYTFGVLICYEDTDSTLCRKMVLDKEGKKADFLVNISNDGWYVRYKDGKVYPTVEQAQRMAITVFRCIENRISILRSVNTGISCLIDSLGRIRDDFIAGSLPKEAVLRQGPRAEGWFVDRIVLDSRISFFTRWGRRLDGLLGIAFLGIVSAALADRLIVIGRQKGNRV